MAYDDELGDTLKAIEAVETSRHARDDDFVMIRVDGRGFSKFTSTMEKPHDRRMAAAMRGTATDLLEHFGAEIVYAQSDEITLIFKPGKVPFGGRLQKLASAVAGKATVFFVLRALKEFPDLVLAKAPSFDGRAVATDSRHAAMFIVWRELDARRNAALGAGRMLFSQSQLNGKSPSEIKESLRAADIDFEMQFDEFFRRGSIFRKRAVEAALTEEELAAIPEKHRESKRGEIFTRNRVEELTGLPSLYDVENIEDFLFEDAEPIVVQKTFFRTLMEPGR